LLLAVIPVLLYVVSVTLADVTVNVVELGTVRIVYVAFRSVSPVTPAIARCY
jgi:hypothetical protein